MSEKHDEHGIYEKYIKRPMDLVLGLLTIIVLWWLYILLAFLVRINLGSPVLFIQERPGKDEMIFKLYKFRTMTNARDENGVLLPDENRLTKFGKFLRSTSLDELPEVFNIIRGDMSVVGPRPLLPQYLPYYKEGERERHAVRPGLTGYAQIHGRNYLMWDKRLDMDVQYVKHITFLGDVKVIFRTIIKVIKRSDIAEKRIPPLDQIREKEKEHAV